jgi:hypothetical protein
VSVTGVPLLSVIDFLDDLPLGLVEALLLNRKYVRREKLRGMVRNVIEGKSGGGCHSKNS